jgi:3-methyl-2-oxobutanoate hydroxymethyltransferase
MSSHTSPASISVATRKAITLPHLRQLHASGEKITMLTAYDATFARIADDSGVECLLVGDSLGMVLQGYSSTVPVSMADMLYHTRCVAAGARTAWIVGDLPYGSYHENLEQAYRNACALMQAGAHMVKLEGGGWTVPVVHYLSERGIPVCAHLGLTPQSVHALGGYRIQGKDGASAAKLKADALALEAAGAVLCVLELMPSSVANAVTEACQHMATIGIGAGNGTAGQVLVLHDMLGITTGKVPRFVKNFLQAQTLSASTNATATTLSPSVAQAIADYVREVKAGSFPDNVLHGY